MSNNKVNKLQTAIDGKAKDLANKDANNFMNFLRNSFSANMDCHIFHKIKDELPEAFAQEHVDLVIKAMRETVYKKSFDNHQDNELRNIRSMLDFMNQYADDSAETE